MFFRIRTFFILFETIIFSGLALILGDEAELFEIDDEADFTGAEVIRIGSNWGFLLCWVRVEFPACCCGGGGGGATGAVAWLDGCGGAIFMCSKSYLSMASRSLLANEFGFSFTTVSFSGSFSIDCCCCCCCCCPCDGGWFGWAKRVCCCCFFWNATAASARSAVCRLVAVGLVELVFDDDESSKLFDVAIKQKQKTMSFMG